MTLPATSRPSYLWPVELIILRLGRIYFLRRSKEKTIVRIEEYGPVTCSVPPNSSFVLVDVPLRAVGDGPGGEAEYRYRMGTFLGRAVPWSLEQNPELTIRLRIPAEKFRPAEDILLEVIDKGSRAVLFKKSWKAAWRGDAPTVESTDEEDSFGPKWSVRARRHRQQD